VFSQIGPIQIATILVIVLLLFGVGKLPQVGKGMGQAINEFKSAINNKTDSTDSDSDSDSGDQNTDTKTT
jgi:sec-independent protein translocase protein TatA